MNAEDCAAIVNRITSTWPTGPRGFIWTEQLANLDHDPALRTYRQLARTDEHPPTIARFHAAYRANTTPASGIPPSPDTGAVIPPHVGKRVAWQAYVAECRGAGREPNRGWFNECLGAPSST
jgi:hypothetical protein